MRFLGENTRPEGQSERRDWSSLGQPKEKIEVDTFNNLKIVARGVGLDKDGDREWGGKCFTGSGRNLI